MPCFFLCVMSLKYRRYLSLLSLEMRWWSPSSVAPRTSSAPEIDCSLSWTKKMERITAYVQWYNDEIVLNSTTL